MVVTQLTGGLEELKVGGKLSVGDEGGESKGRLEGGWVAETCRGLVDGGNSVNRRPIRVGSRRKTGRWGLGRASHR